MVKLSTFGACALLSLATQTVAQGLLGGQNVNIMCFGASIVSKCWRANLQQNLRDQGVNNFKFVGSQTGACAGNNIQQAHEGHPGSLATDDAKYGNLTGWLNENPPDVVIMLIGTNDVLANKTSVDVLPAYDTLIGQMRSKNPKVQIVMSNLLPLDPARFPATAVSGIKAMNSAIASYAPGKSTQQSPVYAVDNYSNFDPVSDTVDGEHPNDSGNAKMGAKFLYMTKTAIHGATNLGVTSNKMKQSVLDNDFTIAVQQFLRMGTGQS